ncbi:DUF202 domain-containing protein [Mucor ambiguus]|uniref:DUF202 domain-containing protein n=1 Tax=Mucor ambiguus TaxID=91626 RepID=A0A0C9N8I8_9FUNG|nr:DUF202 domain-containing protein [Mucor ambiguus]
MSFTNNAEAGPSAPTRTNSISKPLQQPKLELADKVEVYDSTILEDCLDYSLLVSNNISMARDQLANERNWLTWFRLSCTLIILGFTVLIQFRLPEENQDAPRADITNKPVGYIFVAIGLTCFFVGVGKYFKSQRLLVKQATYVEAGWGSYIAVAILFVFVCTIMILASTNASATSFLQQQQ